MSDRPFDGSVAVPEWDPGAYLPALADRGPRNAWDTLVVAGIQLTAIAYVETERESRIDVKETAGTVGATITNTGTPPGRATIRLRCLTTDDLAQWVELVPQLLAMTHQVDPKTRKSMQSTYPKAVQVYHPALAAVGIDALILASTSGPKSAGPGSYMEVVTKWVEFFPPRLTGVHTSQGTDTVTAPKKVAPQFQKPTKPGAGGAPAPK